MAGPLEILPRAVDHGGDPVLILEAAHIDCDAGVLRFRTVAGDAGNRVEHVVGVARRPALHRVTRDDADGSRFLVDPVGCPLKAGARIGISPGFAGHDNPLQNGRAFLRAWRPAFLRGR